jgi:hypothetical protein
MTGLRAIPSIFWSVPVPWGITRQRNTLHTPKESQKVSYVHHLIINGRTICSKLRYLRETGILMVCFSLILHAHCSLGKSTHKIPTTDKSVKWLNIFLFLKVKKRDHICSLVVRVLGYRSRGPGFDNQCYQLF